LYEQLVSVVSEVGLNVAKQSDPIGFGRSLLLLWVAYWSLKPSFTKSVAKVAEHLNSVEDKLEKLVFSVSSLQHTMLDHERQNRVEMNEVKNSVKCVEIRMEGIEHKVELIDCVRMQCNKGGRNVREDGKGV
jgi:hypothetical protein